MKTRLIKLLPALSAVLICVALASVAWIGRARRQHADEASIMRTLASAARFADSTELSLRRQPAESIATRDAMAAMYFERLRLGLGSPFRLVEEAARDPMLPPSARLQVANALLARTLMGLAYHTEPEALDVIESDQTTGPADGAAHLAFIDSLVGSTSDPRVGELLVRLTYRMSAASGVLGSKAPELATEVAAQARDRALAMGDARALISAAGRQGGEPLEMLRAWRSTRRFMVERPVVAALSPRDERSAVAALPRAVARLEAIAALPAPDGEPAPFRIADGLARRMAGLAALRDAPPRAPVAVTVAGFSTMLTVGALTSGERELRKRFIGRAINEETLAAEYTLLRARTRTRSPAAAVSVLTAGVALRPFAQEPVWFPGDAAPSTIELQSRFGLASIAFDESVSPAWRPYFRRSLAIAISDMRRVFPAFDVTGLNVRFGESPLKEKALALHDPVSRTLYLPVSSSGGALAHEFAHDMDWQAARTTYGTLMGYRTDHAVRQHSDWLAGALRRMASASRPEGPGRDPMLERPTEVFARNVDWFVGAALSRTGRMNGYLSAVQDPVLTGYASATTPEVAHGAGEATLRALDGIAPLTPELREWFDEHYGAGRHATVHEAVRRVLEAPVTTTDVRQVEPTSIYAGDATAALLRTVPASSTAWSCLLDAYASQSEDAQATRAVMQFAAEARARGIVRRWSSLLDRYGPNGPWRWRALSGAPWDASVRDATTRELRDAILWRSLRADGNGSAPLLDGSATTSCSR